MIFDPNNMTKDTGVLTMELDQEYFAKSANRKAQLVWLLIAIVLTVAYTIELIKGGRTPAYYTVFMLFCWVP